MVKCQVCGKEFRKIAPAHLRCHDMTMAQYRTLYPSARVVSEEVCRQMSKTHTGLRRSKEQCQAMSEGIKRSYERDGGRLKDERSRSNRVSWERGDRDHLRGPSHYNWRGGEAIVYPPEFSERFREAVRERDGHRCAICWLPGCDVHHVDQDKQNTQTSNCITLCRSCHMAIHRYSNYEDYWQVELQQFVSIREVLQKERQWYMQIAL